MTGAAALRERVRSVLESDPGRAQLAALRAAARSGEPDPRPLYRLLGRHGLLAVTWPREHGGGGGGGAELAALEEELVRFGVPDNPHVLTIQIVGSFVLRFGSDEQRRRLLPGMARGELFASVLFSEPEAGSDLASLSARADALPDGGWAISGRKRYSLKSSMADWFLCLARTGHDQSKYQGLTLFLVPAAASGLRVRRLPGMADEAFHEVELAEVRVGPDDVVGGAGAGWSLLPRFLALERSGIDYEVRARHWLDSAARRAAGTELAADAGWWESVGRQWGRAEAGRLVALEALAAIHDRGELDATTTAMAKWYCSETGQQVAWWAIETVGPAGEPFDAAYREAPGMTISAGASEILLEQVAGALGTGPPDLGAADPVRLALQETLRGSLGRSVALAADDDERGRRAWRDVAALGGFGFELPAAVGGLDLGLGAAVVVCEELGRAQCPGPLESLFAVDLLARAGGAGWAEVLARATAGEVALAVAGPDAGLAVDPERRVLGGRGVSGAGAGAADWLVVVAGTALACVPARAPGVRVEERKALREPAPGRCSFRGVRLEGGALLAAGAAAEEVAADAVARARVRHGALLLGMAARAVELAVARTAERRQFGRPLLELPGVGPRLAAAAGRRAAARLLVHEAAAACDAGAPEARGTSAAALAMSAEVALEATRLAVQLHGSWGMLEEGRVERLYRQAAAEALRHGPPRELWRAAGGAYLARLPAAAREPARV